MQSDRQLARLFVAYKDFADFVVDVHSLQNLVKDALAPASVSYEYLQSQLLSVQRRILLLQDS